MSDQTPAAGDVPPPEAEAEAGAPASSESAEAAADATRATLPAADALRMLRAGQKLDGVRIVGLRLHGDFEQPIEMHECTLVDLRIDRAAFKSPVRFLACTLIRPKFNKKPVFASDLAFSGSRFRNASLCDFTVQGKFSADNIETSGTFKIRWSTFEKLASFWSARFAGWADLDGCTFRHQADLRNMEADQASTSASAASRATPSFAARSSPRSSASKRPTSRSCSTSPRPSSTTSSTSSRSRSAPPAASRSPMRSPNASASRRNNSWAASPAKRPTTTRRPCRSTAC